MSDYCRVADDCLHHGVWISGPNGDRYECDDCGEPMKPPPPDPNPDKLIRALAAILDTLSSSDPLKLRKAQLLDMRTRTLQIASRALGQSIPLGSFTDPEETAEAPLPVFREPSANYVTALRLVMGYSGPNQFLRDLQRAVETYGGLTARQTEAVLMPPSEADVDEMRRVGVVPDSVDYHWQALDAARLARARIREAIKAEAQE